MEAIITGLKDRLLTIADAAYLLATDTAAIKADRKIKKYEVVDSEKDCNRLMVMAASLPVSAQLKVCAIDTLTAFVIECLSGLLYEDDQRDCVRDLLYGCSIEDKVKMARALVALEIYSNLRRKSDVDEALANMPSINPYLQPVSYVQARTIFNRCKVHGYRGLFFGIPGSM